MPRRNDISSILIIGSGPIVIGQACEFDYSGTQACEVLRKEGYRVVLVNSNPATIMTDPEMADRTYIEPITAESLTKIIARERPDALLPTLGGQTALNAAMELAETGVLARFDVEMIGCDPQAIKRGENRREFNAAMEEIGLELARSAYVHSVGEAIEQAAVLGYPLVVRPSFTLGGAGGGIARDEETLKEIVAQGVELSPVGEVLIEESIEGWKEYEMEVMRDAAGNGIVICSIENLDPMGVHTGDSITVAPAQTLSDPEYQCMRSASLAVLEKVGVATGGSNVQFAVNPENGRMIIIEMNPRVSRSSALASKATGFPIAKAAARLAVGYTLDEILNDITGVTPAAFEPSIDYCVVKLPRFSFDKFPGTDDTLTTRMKAVGEIMAIGRTFEEALGKAARSLEDGGIGLVDVSGAFEKLDDVQLEQAVRRPAANRVLAVVEALRREWPVAKVHALSGIDAFFLHRMADMVAIQSGLAGLTLAELDADALWVCKRYGISDAAIAHAVNAKEKEVRARRIELGVVPAFKMVDTCAAEFAARTRYLYKTYDAVLDEADCTDKPKIIILGSGPNRIGQGVEFDYCCVHACYALADAGFETIMVNCNPETVSTDYDTSDKLYFEPLTFEDVMDIVEAEQPNGVIVTLGGQTPLKLARALEEAGVSILGTQPAAIDLAEDRERFASLLDRLHVAYPSSGVAFDAESAADVASHIGYPLIVRPSYVLGGAGMAVVHDEDQLAGYLVRATAVSDERPVYLDRFLDDAVEVDVDAVCDGESVFVGGILEHIEMAGIHSGDSACCTPPFSLSDDVCARLRAITRDIARALDTVGLVNVQYAIRANRIYVIEANPRASRTVPFASKATGVPLAKVAALVMAGIPLDKMGLPPDDRELSRFSVKEAVLPWSRFPGSEVSLGPEMKSTGEVMGIGYAFPIAYAKAQQAVDTQLRTGGKAFISVCDRDKRAIAPIAFDLERNGFELVATKGTASVLRAAGLNCTVVGKVRDGSPNIADAIRQGLIDLIVNTPSGSESNSDGQQIRALAVLHGISHTTTIAGAQALALAFDAVAVGRTDPIALQDLPQWHPSARTILEGGAASRGEGEVQL